MSARTDLAAEWHAIAAEHRDIARAWREVAEAAVRVAEMGGRPDLPAAVHRVEEVSRGGE